MVNWKVITSVAKKKERKVSIRLAFKKEK